MPTLILVRHGQSLWNLENRFTGWTDVPLTAKGIEEARNAGRLLAGHNIEVAYTSSLCRARDTLTEILALQKSNSSNVPIISTSALNERNYGDLTGLNKDKVRAEYGDEQLRIWRRSYDIAPPNGESLKDTKERVLPLLQDSILDDIKQNKDVLVVAHGNSNRSIVMVLENVSPEKIVERELETGVPLVYQLDICANVLSVTTLCAEN